MYLGVGDTLIQNIVNDRFIDNIYFFSLIANIFTRYFYDITL